MSLCMYIEGGKRWQLLLAYRVWYDGGGGKKKRRVRHGGRRVGTRNAVSIGKSCSDHLLLQLGEIEGWSFVIAAAEEKETQKKKLSIWPPTKKVGRGGNVGVYR